MKIKRILLSVLCAVFALSCQKDVVEDVQFGPEGQTYFTLSFNASGLADGTKVGFNPTADSDSYLYWAGDEELLVYDSSNSYANYTASITKVDATSASFEVASFQVAAGATEISILATLGNVEHTTNGAYKVTLPELALTHNGSYDYETYAKNLPFISPVATAEVETTTGGATNYTGEAPTLTMLPAFHALRLSLSEIDTYYTTAEVGYISATVEITDGNFYEDLTVDSSKIPTGTEAKAAFATSDVITAGTTTTSVKSITSSVTYTNAVSLASLSDFLIPMVSLGTSATVSSIKVTVEFYTAAEGVLVASAEEEFTYDSAFSVGAINKVTIDDDSFTYDQNKADFTLTAQGTAQAEIKVDWTLPTGVDDITGVNIYYGVTVDSGVQTYEETPIFVTGTGTLTYTLGETSEELDWKEDYTVYVEVVTESSDTFASAPQSVETTAMVDIAQSSTGAGNYDIYTLAGLKAFASIVKGDVSSTPEDTNISGFTWTSTADYDANATLMASIELDGDVQIGVAGSVTYNGTFDGGSKTISNVTAPLFAAVESATIKNLTISGVVTSDTVTGGIVDTIAAGSTTTTFDNVISSVTVTIGGVASNYAYGFVGTNNSTVTFTNCQDTTLDAENTISTGDGVSAVTVSTVEATAAGTSIVVTWTEAGASNNYDYVVVTYTYTDGAATTETVAAIASDETASFTTTPGIAYTVTVETVNITGSATSEDSGSASSWTVTPTAPVGDIALVSSNDNMASEHYEIYTAKGLQAFASIVNGYDSSTKPTATGVTWTDSAAANASANAFIMDAIDLSELDAVQGTRENWTPIGIAVRTSTTEGAITPTTTYSGVFDGNNQTISNLYVNITTADTNVYALFGYISGATIQNVVLDDVSITTMTSTDASNYYTAALVSYAANSSTIKDCTVKSTTASSVTGAAQPVGGVAGYVASVTIEGCYNYAAVTGTNNGVGGVVGQILGATVKGCYNYGKVVAKGYSGGVIGKADSGYANIESCHNMAEVAATNHNGSSGFIGGIVGYYNAKGYNTGSSINTAYSYIVDCTNTQKVSATGAGVGGIVGNFNPKDNYSYISGCTNSGYVSGGTSTYSVGGIVGVITNTYTTGSTIINSSNSGSVDGTYQVGGIVGLSHANAIISGESADSRSTNSGDVTATDTSKVTVGGIVGSNLAGTVQYYDNSGVVKIGSDDVTYLYGIFGTKDEAGTITDCSVTTTDIAPSAVTVTGFAVNGEPVSSTSLDITWSYEGDSAANVASVTITYTASDDSTTDPVVITVNGESTVNSTTLENLTTGVTYTLASITSTNVQSTVDGSLGDYTTGITIGEDTTVYSIKLVAASADGYTADTYEITDADGLMAFASIVNGYDGDSTPKPTATANFAWETTAEADADANAVVKDDIDLTGKTWAPMTDYAGIFDGGNGLTNTTALYEEKTDASSIYKITGLTGSNGLFKSSTGTIKNVTLDATITDAGTQGGILVGGAGEASVAGTISHCRIYGSLVGTGGNSGAIAGGASNTLSISYTQNYASVTCSDQSHCTGFVTTSTGNRKITIDNCMNYGDISAKNASGFVAYNAGGTDISNSYNYGAITGSGDEVAGFINSTGGTNTIKNCHNHGVISTSSGSLVGGIVGTAGNAVTITYCTNNNTVTGTASNGVGGIIGRSANVNNSIIGCTNNSAGAVQGAGCVGGIVGNVSVTATTLTGAYNDGEDDGVNISSSYNYGTVSATGNVTTVGGIVGNTSTDASTVVTITNYINSGVVNTNTSSSSTQVNYLYGITGGTFLGTTTGCSDSSIAAPVQITLSKFGVNASTETTVDVEWSLSSGNNIKDVIIYYGTSKESLTTTKSVAVNLGTTPTSTSIENLSTGMTYYFYVVSSNISGETIALKGATTGLDDDTSALSASNPYKVEIEGSKNIDLVYYAAVANTLGDAGDNSVEAYYEIRTADGLKAFADLVNDKGNTIGVIFNSTDVSGETGTTTAESTFSRPSGAQVNANAKVANSISNVGDWTSYTMVNYNGTFDGNNGFDGTMSTVVVDNSTGAVTVSNTWNTANVGTNEIVISGITGSAGLFTSTNTDAVIKNVTLDVDLTFTAATKGALVSSAKGKISYCRTYGYISAGTFNNIGGIGGTGNSALAIEYSHNYATIKTTGEHAAGTVSTSALTTYYCENHGTINAKTGAGISGYTSGSQKFMGCVNYGYIYGSTKETAGIINSVRGGSYIDCHNYGTIHCAGDSVGGIVGTIGNSAATITGCSNYGIVTGDESVGGIVGANSVATTIDGAYTSEDGVLPVVNVSKSYNKGYVNGSVSATTGGIVGYTTAGSLASYENTARVTTGGTFTATTSTDATTGVITYTGGTFGASLEDVTSSVGLVGSSSTVTPAETCTNSYSSSSN